MAKPVQVPTWATDTNYSTGAFSGTPTKTEPSTPKKARGWDPGEKPGAQSLNWWKNLTGAWLDFLNPLFTSGGGFTAATNEHVTVSGTGEFKHGDRTMVISALDMKPSTHGNHTYQITPVAINSTATITFVGAIVLDVGERLKTVTFAIKGDGVTNMRLEVYKTTSPPSPADTKIGDSGVLTPSATWTDSLVNVTDTTIAAGEAIGFFITCNGTGLSAGNVKCVYDHP